MATRVLIVDDDPLILETICFFVSSFGYACDTASSGLEALDILTREEFQIIISDIVMPGMNGMELLKQVKNFYPKIGVIIVTGYAENYSYSDVIRAGAIDFISKPFQKDELEAKLDRVVREQNMIHELERLSNCDALTGLYNRRYFDIKLTEEVQRAARQDYRVVLGMLDIDCFKGFNDTYGHQTGDKLLKIVGHVLRTCTRENVDFLFRYGGDEFSFILTQTNIDQASKVAERILTTYRDQEFDIGETSISIGLVQCDPEENKSWQENSSVLVGKADQALYKAKNNGRNQVCIWSNIQA